jgi:hypothetical protein
MNSFACQSCQRLLRMLSSHALTPNEEKRPGLVCRFLKGVRCTRRPPAPGKGGGAARLHCPSNRTQFLGMGPKIWQMGPGISRWDPNLADWVPTDMGSCFRWSPLGSGAWPYSGFLGCGLSGKGQSRNPSTSLRRPFAGLWPRLGACACSRAYSFADRLCGRWAV